MLHQRSQRHSHCLLAAVRPACLQCRQGPGEHRAYGGAGATGDYGARSAWLPRAGPGLGLRPVAFISLQVLVSSVKGTKSQSSWQGVFLKCLGCDVHAGQPGCVFCLLCWLRTPVGPGPPVVPAGPRPGCFTASIRGSVQGNGTPLAQPVPQTAWIRLSGGPGVCTFKRRAGDSQGPWRGGSWWSGWEQS